MRVYRLVDRAYAEDAWSGDGARRFGGRWNSIGVPMVYTATHVSLAALEVLVHLQSLRALAQHWQLVAADVAEDTLLEIDEADIPADYAATPAPGSTAAVGDAWIRSNVSVGLLVPSAVVPLERVALLNPLHPEFADAVDIQPALPFAFDPRLTA